MHAEPEPDSQSEKEAVGRYEGSESSDEDPTALTLMASRQIKRQLTIAEAEDGGEAKPETFAARCVGFFTSLLWPGWLLDHLDWPSLKIVSRTWAHIWVSALLIAIPTSLKWLGGAAFLMMILSCIDPVGGQSIALAAINSLLTIYVAVIAFTAQVIVNAINWRIRGKPTLAEVVAKMVQAGECVPNDRLCIQATLLDGRYLSTRTTAVTIFGIFSTTAFMVWLGQRKRLQTHLRTPVIFSIICIHIALTFSNHIPQFDPWTVGKAYMVPVFIACACRMVFAIIWFPISSSCNCTNSVWRLHAKLASTAQELNEKVEATTLGSSKFDELADSFTTSFNPPPVFWGMLRFDQPLMRLECLYARLDPEDIEEFVISARRIAACQSAFTFFFQEFMDLRASIREGKPRGDPMRRRRTSTSRSLHQRYTGRRGTTIGAARTTGADSGATSYSGWLREKLSREYAATGNFETAYERNVENENVRFESLDEVDTIYRAVIAHYKPLLKAVNDAGHMVSEWLDDANKFRATTLISPIYRKKRIARQAHFAAVVQDSLQCMDDEYRVAKQDPHWILRELHRDGSTLDDDQRAYAIAQDVFYESLVLRLFDIVRKTCRWCVYIDTTRPRATLIHPLAKVEGGKRAKIAAYFRKLDGSLDLEELRSPEKTTPFKPKVGNAQRRNPNSSPPRNMFHLAGSWLVRIRHDFSSDDAIFIYKKSSCALIPLTLYFVRPTLRWAYGYRILWVAVMAALTTSPRAGDCVYTLLVRVCMTFFGCLLGLVAWYISAGHGKGNPYGFGGCSVVLALILAYTRHFMTLGGIQGKIVLSVTVTLVYSVSYVDGVGISVTLLTYGWSVAWIRFVSVLIGVCIGFIATILPHAETIKKTVRVQMAGLLRSTALIQTEIVNFALQRYEDDTVHQTIVKDAIIEYITQSMQSLSVLTLNMASLKYEPPLTGVWPKAHYNLLLRLLSELRYLQASLYYTFNRVNRTTEIIDILEAMGMLDSNILAGTYSSVYMCGTSLTTGQALPTITPGHLAQDHRLLLRQQFGDENPLETVKMLSIKPDGRLLLVCVNTAQLYFRRLDGIMAVVKRLVGEDFGVDTQLSHWITQDH